MFWIFVKIAPQCSLLDWFWNTPKPYGPCHATCLRAYADSKGPESDQDLHCSLTVSYWILQNVWMESKNPNFIQAQDHRSTVFLTSFRKSFFAWPFTQKWICKLLSCTICRKMHKKFYSSHWFYKDQILSLFPIVKMNANYAEICRVGNLKSVCQQVLLVQFFWNFHNIAAKHQ